MQDEDGGMEFLLDSGYSLFIFHNVLDGWAWIPFCTLAENTEILHPVSNHSPSFSVLTSSFSARIQRLHVNSWKCASIMRYTRGRQCSSVELVAYVGCWAATLTQQLCFPVTSAVCLTWPVFITPSRDVMYRCNVESRSLWSVDSCTDTQINSHSFNAATIIMPPTHRVGTSSVDGRCLSVCLSVQCLTLE